MKAKMTPDGGYKVIDVCNENAEKYTKKYEELEKLEKDLLLQLEDIKNEKKKLRIAEVYNVCDYVRVYTGLGVLDAHDIDGLLCHCQNMLNGNIDGTFITFHKE